MCATSIVKLGAFDRNWTSEFRSQFKSPPGEWLQQGSDGKPLVSWYGGDYQPACMSNPDWRKYEKFIVRKTLEAGGDGIFFDNPTVHPNGCYCRYCMEKFAKFLSAEHGAGHVDVPADGSVELLRKIAMDRPKDFLRFRGTVASDFLADMRAYARTIKPAALITCNNSLNSPEVLFSQCRTYGYNIHAMSAVEDLVVVEDMSSQPRILSDGKQFVEYGPVYEMLHAISHDKPIVAVTIAEGDYTTPPNLCRLAMAEAAAHGASYLSWPTWPENERAKMASGLRPQAEFLRENAALLNATEVRAEALVFLPFQRWVDTPNCQTLGVIRALSAANVQYRVVCEDDLEKSLLAADGPKDLIVESAEILTDAQKAVIEKYKASGGRVIWSQSPTWFKEFQAAATVPAVVVDHQPAIRIVMRSQGTRTIVHVLNLNVERVSSFQDRVKSASNVQVSLRYSGKNPTSVAAPAPIQMRRAAQFHSARVMTNMASRSS